MQLSDELYADIRAALNIKRKYAGEAAENKRRDVRLAVDHELILEPYGVSKPKPRPVYLRNFSSTGVRIIDRQVMHAGEQFLLHLPRRSGPAVPIICTVRNCRVSADGAFKIGAEFTAHAEKGRDYRPMICDIEDAERRDAGLERVREAAALSPAPAPGDKRLDPRRDEVLPLRIMNYCDGVQGPLEEAETADISSSGICIVHRRAMRNGEQFLAQTRANAEKRQWLPYGRRWLLYRATSCRLLNDGRFRIGAALIGTVRIATPHKGLFATMRHWLSVPVGDPST